jgi:hypothetical protein
MRVGLFTIGLERGYRCWDFPKDVLEDAKFAKGLQQRGSAMKSLIEFSFRFCNSRVHVELEWIFKKARWMTFLPGPRIV